MKKIFALILALAAVFLCASCGAANGNLSGSVFYTGEGSYANFRDCYLQVNGIEGECWDSKHDKWIDVLSFGFGVDHPVSDYGTIKPKGSFFIVHKVDVATPSFGKSVDMAQMIGDVKLEKAKILSGKQVVWLTISLTGAVAVSSETSVDINGELIETVEFTFKTATVTYTKINPDSSIGETLTETIEGIRY